MSYEQCYRDSVHFAVPLSKRGILVFGKICEKCHRNLRNTTRYLVDETIRGSYRSCVSLTCPSSVTGVLYMHVGKSILKLATALIMKGNLSFVLCIENEELYVVQYDIKFND